MTEYCSRTVTRFVRGLGSKIRCAMITGSCDLDTVEEAFDAVLKIDLKFKDRLDFRKVSQYQNSVF